MPKNVVCKKCNNLVNDWCEKVIDSPDHDMQRDCQYFCEKTNAQKIRAMSDEELAEFIDRCEMSDIDYAKTFCDLCNGQYECAQCRLDWLRQPAE